MKNPLDVFQLANVGTDVDVLSADWPDLHYGALWAAAAASLMLLGPEEGLTQRAAKADTGSSGESGPGASVLPICVCARACVCMRLCPSSAEPPG